LVKMHAHKISLDLSRAFRIRREFLLLPLIGTKDREGPVKRVGRDVRKRSFRDPHRTVYGYDRKNYGYLRVLTGRNRNRIHSLMALYGTVTVTVRLLRPYTVV
jgi:hypothetical protein